MHGREAARGVEGRLVREPPHRLGARRRAHRRYEIHHDLTKRRRCVWQHLRRRLRRGWPWSAAERSSTAEKVRDVGPEAVEGEVRSGSECGRAPRG